MYNFDDKTFDWDIKTKYTNDYKEADTIENINTTKIKHSITIRLVIRANGRKYSALIIF